MQLHQLQDLDVNGKKVLVRLDLNVPVKGGEVTDTTRIDGALETLRYLKNNGAKVVICSHLGRPKGKVDPEKSLEPIGAVLAEKMGLEILFVDDYVTESVSNILAGLESTQMVLLENLRFHEGETKGDREFAQTLATGFDMYVNDAFGTVHRAHASVSGVPSLMQPGSVAAGFLIQKEVAELTRLSKGAKAPFVVVIGGAKVADKIGVILNMLDHCNTVLIGGAMAYSFLKYRGIDVGKSLVEDDKLDLVETIYRNAETRKVKIEVPVDHVCATEFSESAKPEPVSSASIPAGLMGLDIGPKTIQIYQRHIIAAQTVLWNGPMGVFEFPEFSKGTFAVADAVARCDGYTLVGGGDSVAAINKAGVADRVSHISTGGGASLEFLEGKTLPGLQALMKR